MKPPTETPLDEIRRQLLVLFADSIGYEFRIKGTPLTDTIIGVDVLKLMVIGRTYGDFHVDLCELTGK
jgi:hypothetical protein